jgi:hypothetical protein
MLPQTTVNIYFKYFIPHGRTFICYPGPIFHLNTPQVQPRIQENHAIDDRIEGNQTKSSLCLGLPTVQSSLGTDSLCPKL